MASASLDAKSLLAQAFQYLAGRPVAKGDIVYSAEADGEVANLRFRATVVFCDSSGCIRLSGQACASKKEAEKSAAAAALEHLVCAGRISPDIAPFPPRAPGWIYHHVDQPHAFPPAPPPTGIQRPSLKRPRCVSASSLGGSDGDWLAGWLVGGGAWDAGAWQANGLPEASCMPQLPRLQGVVTHGRLMRPIQHAANENPAVNSKGLLQSIVSKKLGRPFTKEDWVISMELADGFFVAHLELPAVSELGLPGCPAHYVGAACARRRDAEQASAAEAVRWLQGRLGASAAPAAAAPVANEPPAKRQKLVAPPTALASGEELAGLNRQRAEELVKWRDERLYLPDVDDEESPNDPRSLDYWYGQACLVCSSIVAKSSWSLHVAGQRHCKAFRTTPYRIRPGVWRPPTAPDQELQPAENFLEVGSWACAKRGSGALPSVLLVGEMDYSFSLAVAELRPVGVRAATTVATSYLKAHDPAEPEVYPKDDGERGRYRRQTLPSMMGALQRNLNVLRARGVQVRYGVDAMDLDGTLRQQGIGGPFDIIIFPFPRATLQRACDPRNSRLLRELFYSARQHGFLCEGGVVQLVMLGTQYEEWDVAGMAADAGFALKARASLPRDFYQAREMSGKPWVPQGGELLCFQAVDDVNDYAGSNIDEEVQEDKVSFEEAEEDDELSHSRPGCDPWGNQIVNADAEAPPGWARRVSPHAVPRSMPRPTTAVALSASPADAPRRMPRPTTAVAWSASPADAPRRMPRRTTGVAWSASPAEAPRRMPPPCRGPTNAPRRRSPPPRPPPPPTTAVVGRGPPPVLMNIHPYGAPLSRFSPSQNVFKDGTPRYH